MTEVLSFAGNYRIGAEEILPAAALNRPHPNFASVSITIEVFRPILRLELRAYTDLEP